jgi:hypothetical protein
MRRVLARDKQWFCGVSRDTPLVPRVFPAKPTHETAVPRGCPNHSFDAGGGTGL